MALSHGDLEICVLDNVITVAFIGSFNAEGIRNYAIKMQSIVTSLKEQPFFMIINNSKFEGATPEGFEELNVFNTWLNNTQIKAKAFIINSETNKQIIINRTPSLLLQNTKFFSNYQEAKMWLTKFY